MEFLFKTYAVGVGFIVILSLIVYITMIGAFLTLNAIRRAIRIISWYLQKGQSDPATRVVPQEEACMVPVMSIPTAVSSNERTSLAPSRKAPHAARLATGGTSTPKANYDLSCP